VPRTRLKILLKFDRTVRILKTEMKHYLQRTIFGCMRRPARIMRSKSFIEITGNAYVELTWDRDALEEVDVLHKAVPLRTMVLRGTAFAKASVWLACQPKL
jgi:hypothetical protein